MEDIEEDFDLLLLELIQESGSSVESYSVTSSSSQNPIEPGKSLQQQQQTKTRKKRKNTRKPSFRPAFMPALRIIKRDIRRKYPEMLQNVVNLHDISLLQQFLEEFSLPNLETFDENAPAFAYERFNWPKHARGYDRLLEAMNMSFLVFPDAIYTLHDIKISVTLNERGSRLVGTLKCLRTQIFDIQFLKNGSKSTNNPNDVGDNKVAVDHQPPYQLVRAEKPLINELEAKVYLQLDEYHRIETVQILFEQFTLTEAAQLL